LVATLLVLAFGGGAAIGLLGAPAGQTFAWGLFAQGATAFGTVLLAAYTASLARSTSREVAVTVEEQRARERPVVAAVIEDFSAAILEPTWGERVPVVNVRLLNVGLGPALDLQLEVSYPDAEGVGTEVVSVLPVGDEQIRAIPVPEIQPPSDGFLAERFRLVGTFEGRTRDVREHITLLAERGLRDLQRAAQRRAAVKGNPYFSVGGQLNATETTVEYQCSVGNTARGTAFDTEIVFRDAEQQQWGDRLIFPRLDPNRGDNATVLLPADHPLLSYVITWRDGEGEHSREEPDALQPLPR
jgi:hypothetical protein